MKVYQLLQQGTGKQVLIMVPADWKIVECPGMPEFAELRDNKGRQAFVLREFDIQELPAVQPTLARAAGQGGDA